jgi:hypothetical protein
MHASGLRTRFRKGAAHLRFCWAKLPIRGFSRLRRSSSSGNPTREDEQFKSLRPIWSRRTMLLNSVRLDASACSRLQ